MKGWLSTYLDDFFENLHYLEHKEIFIGYFEYCVSRWETSLQTLL